jgi:uroporphyrinogen decarboxylase
MDSLGRVRETLDHQEPDLVPLFDFLYNRLSLRGFLKGADPTPERIAKVWLSLGFDLFSVGFDAPKDHKERWVSKDHFVDEWGMKFRADEDMWWYVDGTVRDRDDLGVFEVPDPNAEGRTKTIEWALGRYGDRVAVAPAVSGPFTHVWSLMGFREFVLALHNDRGLVRHLLKAVNDYFIELGKMAIDLGAQIIWIADDLGANKGPMISPAHLRHHVLPRLGEMVRTFKRRGTQVLLHCDGNVMPVMEDIVRTGIDAFHPVERKSGMDISAVKTLFGEDIAIIGNLEASQLIPRGSLGEIDSQIRECFRIGAPGAGYIFASDHSIHPGIPAERARYVYERAERYRRYPGG